MRWRVCDFEAPPFPTPPKALDLALDMVDVAPVDMTSVMLVDKDVAPADTPLSLSSARDGLVRVGIVRIVWIFFMIVFFSPSAGAEAAGLSRLSL